MKENRLPPADDLAAAEAVTACPDAGTRERQIDRVGYSCRCAARRRSGWSMRLERIAGRSTGVSFCGTSTCSSGPANDRSADRAGRRPGHSGAVHGRPICGTLPGGMASESQAARHAPASRGDRTLPLTRALPPLVSHFSERFRWPIAPAGPQLTLSYRSVSP